MKQSTPTTPKPRQPKSILLIGPPGGGKTTLALQFPGLVVFDCDLNLDGPEQFIRKEMKLPLAYSYETITLDVETGKPRPIETCFDYILDQLKVLAANPPVDFQTFVLDGLTFINEFDIQKVLSSQRKTLMEPHFWAPFKSNLMSLLVGRLRSLGVTTIVTCHEFIITRPSTDPKKIMQAEIVGYQPAVQGGIADFFGGFFTDVLRCTSTPGVAGKVDFKLETVKTTLSELKNSMGLPGVMENPTYAKLESYLKGTI